jgi:hypothetical protein
MDRTFQRPISERLLEGSKEPEDQCPVTFPSFYVQAVSHRLVIFFTAF